ncbi:hypothetical protein KCU81_g649, partial [Aureobasidium melanogenum]
MQTMRAAYHFKAFHFLSTVSCFLKYARQSKELGFCLFLESSSRWLLFLFLPLPLCMLVPVLLKYVRVLEACCWLPSGCITCQFVVEVGNVLAFVVSFAGGASACLSVNEATSFALSSSFVTTIVSYKMLQRSSRGPGAPDTDLARTDEVSEAESESVTLLYLRAFAARHSCCLISSSLTSFSNV